MEEEPPPPPPMLRAPPALPDELVEEVLFRSPPDDPARLVRAALVPPRLGPRLPPSLPRLSPPAPGCPDAGLPPQRVRVRRRMLPPPRPLGPHLRVLPAPQHSARLARARRPRPPPPRRRGSCGDSPRRLGPALCRRRRPPGAARPHPAAAPAQLCCDQHGLQDHADGPFRVVLVGTDPEGAFACVYSSFGPAAWSELAYAAQHPDPSDVGGSRIDVVRGALVGNALYFLFKERNSILKYDLTTGDISVIPLPPASYSYIRWMSRMVLTTTEDGGLGFAGVVGYRLHLWSMVLRPNGGALAMGFTQGRTIDLSRLPHSIVLLGFVDDVGIILLGTIDGLMSVDQKSGRIEKLGDGRDFYSDNCVVPYVSFYTPALVTASTDEGPNADA